MPTLVQRLTSAFQAVGVDVGWLMAMFGRANAWMAEQTFADKVSIAQGAKVRWLDAEGAEFASLEAQYEAPFPGYSVAGAQLNLLGVVAFMASNVNGDVWASAPNLHVENEINCPRGSFPNLYVATRARLGSLVLDPALTPYAASLTLNCQDCSVFEIAPLTGSVTSLTLLNATDGLHVRIRVQEDATGARTFALPAGAKVAGSLVTAANRVSWLDMIYSRRAARWEGQWINLPA